MAGLLWVLFYPPYASVPVRVFTFALLPLLAWIAIKESLIYAEFASPTPPAMLLL